MILEYFCVRSNVVKPTRANPSDAGLDVYFNPESPDSGITIPAGGSAVLPSGIKIGIPHNYYLRVENRSSIASKKNLVVGASVIDSGYDAEIFIDLHNIGTQPQQIMAGDKIAQLVMIAIVPFRAMETSEDNLYERYPITISERGSRGFGSSGG